MKIRPCLAVLVTLVVITAAIYARTASFPFCAIDDNDYVAENAHVAAGLTIDSISWAFTSFHASNWHPVTWLSLMADSQFFGTEPMGYHLVNVVLHVVTTALLFILMTTMTGTLWRSAFVAALFALHPLHVESVAWISERKDVLSALFMMITLIFYCDYVKKTKYRSYFLSLVFFAVGLMAKPMLVTLPVVLLLLDYWPLQRSHAGSLANENQFKNRQDVSIGIKGLLLEKTPYLLLSMVSSALTIYAQSNRGAGGAVVALTDLSFFMRVKNALWSVLSYLQKTIYPLDLAIYYPMTTISIWKAGGAAIIICLILYISIRHLRNYPWLIMGWLWYFVTLLPVVGLIQVGGQAMADRYMYIPSIGLFVMASWGAAEIWTQLPKYRSVISFAAVGVIILYSVMTCVQLSYWQNNTKLLEHTTEITINNTFAQYNLGFIYEKQGRTELAIKEFTDALISDPTYPARHLVHLHLGNILSDQGKIEEAISHFEEIIRLKPQFWKAYYNMGVALGKIGRNNEAKSYYNMALNIDPDNAMCHINLGILDAKQGQLDEAIQHFTKAVQLEPGSELARQNLQLALEQRAQKPVR